MRVALLSGNAPRHNAIGNQIAEKVRFFQERGAEVHLFVQDARRLHPDVVSCCVEVTTPSDEGFEWDYLRRADVVIAVYAQYHDLLQYLPRLAGVGPRLVLDYFGVTPAELWSDQHREGLERSARARGYVWCADRALTTSQANCRELLDATHFPREYVATLPLPVDIERFHGAADRFLHDRLGIDGHVLLFVGRLAGNKRVPLLIEALAKLGDPSVHAVIVGESNDVYAAEAARCQAIAQNLGVADRVHFTGSLEEDELPRAYRSAAVLVMPSVHEGFCVPVVEAMASGLPVIASRSTALPETVGGAGLTFQPNDVDDLVRQIRRVLKDARPQPRLAGPRRVAMVSFRFGPNVVGGAESSLRTMAKALQEAGHRVEVFTTCTASESHWQNDLPAGTVTLDGLTVHRFPIALHDPIAHGEIVRAILEVDGRATPEVEQRYLELSIHSPALLDCLRQRAEEFDAVIVGPYLFGLTADVARTMPGKTLLVPCFHDEPLARLGHWPRAYGDVAGILYHSPEEQDFAQIHLGVNHPNTQVIGTSLRNSGRKRQDETTRVIGDPYVVYCGRYSTQKNVPLLVEWARQYQHDRPGRLDVVFMGQGDVKLPSEPWLHDLGRVDEATKRAVLAGAKALVQLSTHESLSLVALEAWAEGTPVVAHRDCAVLAGQIERSQGGVAVADYAGFAAALDELWQDEAIRQTRGGNGRAYVEKHYLSSDRYVARLIEVIDQATKPIGAQMRAKGLQRAQEFARERWQERFTEFIEQSLTQPARPRRDALALEPMRHVLHAAAGTRTALLPVRLLNTGTHAASPDGPGRSVVCVEVSGAGTFERHEVKLPALLVPGQAQVAALPIALPTTNGNYRLQMWVERKSEGQRSASARVVLPLVIGSDDGSQPNSCVSAFLDTVRETLPETHQLQQLPEDYVDVTEGRFAPAKRWIKRKLLNNFKHAYVDVLSRRQSQVNEQVVVMIQQLAECCAMLDHAVAGLHQRLDALEARMHDLPSPEERKEVEEEVHG